MGHATPELVRKEIWTHILAYNIIRTVLAQAASKHDIEPRPISFKGAVQTLEAFQPLLAMQGDRSWEHRLHLYNKLLDALATHRVGDRPDRFEPRQRKRRQKKYNRILKPRHVLDLNVLGLGTEHGPKPVADFFVLNSHLVEQGQYLLVKSRSRNPSPGMAGFCVPSAAIVDAGLGTVLGELCFDFTRDGVTAMAATNQLPAKRGQVRHVVLIPEQRLHSVPSCPVNQRLVLSWLLLALVLDLTDVRPVPENVVNRASRELGRCRREPSPRTNLPEHGEPGLP